MISVGIDYSISSPAVCVHTGIEEFTYDACKFLAIPPFKKRTPFAESYNNKFYFVENLGAGGFPIQRMLHLANTCADFIRIYGGDSYCVEGYSFGGNGQVFQLAENCGIMKSKLHEYNVKQTATPTPSEIKKFATGKGNAKKYHMVEAFKEETGANLYDIFELECNPIKYSMSNIPSPIDDIVDAYFICKMHHVMLANDK